MSGLLPAKTDRADQRSIDVDLMRIKQLTLSIVMIAVISPNLSFGRSLGQSGGKLVKVEKVWGGEIKLELRQQAPPNGLVVDEKAWAKLWMAYRGNEELLKIDFNKQMILVSVGDDLNDIGYDPNSLILDEEGDLKVSFIQTLVGYIIFSGRADEGPRHYSPGVIRQARSTVHVHFYLMGARAK
jgi:hypothetical protein